MHLEHQLTFLLLEYLWAIMLIIPIGHILAIDIKD